MVETMQISSNSRTLVQQRPLQSPEGEIAQHLIAASQLDERVTEQLQTDITAFPAPWLRRFQQEDVTVAVLKDNQTLADTPILHALTEAQIQELVSQSKPLVQAAVAEVMGPLQAIADPGERAYHQRMAAPELEEKLWHVSNERELGFSLQIGREAQDLKYLGEQCGFDPEFESEEFQRWTEALLALNDGLVHRDGDRITPEQGITVIPYMRYKGKDVRALSLLDYKKVSGLELQQNLGANSPDNRLVMLHESVLPNPSPRTGRHRVVLHELGHMVDWICKDLPETAATHEQKVQELFEMARAKPERFLTDRAEDSPGEMMAEAVEAYLTLPEETSQANFYKPKNHRENLQARFPELYNYVDFLMHLDGPASAQTEAQ